MEISIKAEMKELQKAMCWVRMCCAEAGADTKQKGDIELALEEVITNVIHYAYWGEPGEIQLSCNFNEDTVQFIVKDRGVPFDPLKQSPKVDPDATLQERNEGGLGIFFLQKLMDGVQYAREEPYNVLRLMKRIS